jgi:hypothetical protein
MEKSYGRCLDGVLTRSMRKKLMKRRRWSVFALRFLYICALGSLNYNDKKRINRKTKNYKIHVTKGLEGMLA